MRHVLWQFCEDIRRMILMKIIKVDEYVEMYSGNTAILYSVALLLWLTRWNVCVAEQRVCRPRNATSLVSFRHCGSRPSWLSIPYLTEMFINRAKTLNYGNFVRYIRCIVLSRINQMENEVFKNTIKCLNYRTAGGKRIFLISITLIEQFLIYSRTRLIRQFAQFLTFFRRSRQNPYLLCTFLFV